MAGLTQTQRTLIRSQLNLRNTVATSWVWADFPQNLRMVVA